MHTFFFELTHKVGPVDQTILLGLIWRWFQQISSDNVDVDEDSYFYRPIGSAGEHEYHFQGTEN